MRILRQPRKPSPRSGTSPLRLLSGGCLLLVCLFAFSVPVRAGDFGLDGRFGHEALPGFGRHTSGLTHLELFPYWIEADTHALFGDVRGFINNNGELGTNLGAGYRYIEPNGVLLLGVNGWYDADHTVGKLFQQVGLGLEGRTEVGSVNANFYLPVGTEERILSRRISNERFDGNELVFDVTNRVGQAMRGVDTMLGVYLPGSFAREHQLEASAGWYHFTGDDVETINGFRIQFDGRVVRSLFGQVAVTHDGTFGTNVTLGASWRFGTTELPDTRIEGQLRRFVSRNYNVIVSRTTTVEEGVPAINPLTGNPLNVQHVSEGGQSDGTVGNPWQSIADAQAAGADLIFVHGGSTLTESIHLAEGQQLIGEGTPHWITDDTFGRLALPTATGNGNRPVLASVTGDGVRMADGSRLAGFVIDSPGGHGVVAEGVSDFSIVNVTVKDAGEHGFLIENASGRLTDVGVHGGNGSGMLLSGIDDRVDFRNVKVVDVEEHGVHVIGGQGRMTFAGQLEITTPALSGLFIEGLETVTQNGETATGAVHVENLKVAGNDGAHGVQVFNSEGDIFFSDLNISTFNGSAFFLRNAQGVASSDGSVESHGAPLADIEDSSIDLLLTSASAQGGTYGVRILRTDGRFLVFGNDDGNGGGTIENTDVAIYLDQVEKTGFHGVEFKSNKRIAQVENSEALNIASSQITGTSETFIDAVNLELLEVTGSVFEENPLTSETGIRFTATTPGSYVAIFSNNDVTAAPKTLFEALSPGDATSRTLTYSFQGNQIEMSVAQARAAVLDWTGAINAFVTNNIVTGSMPGQTAFDLTTGLSTELAELTVNQNVLALGGTGSTGVNVLTRSPARLQVLENSILFNGRDGVGLRITGERPADMDISANDIIDGAGGATGILFPSVATGSTIFMDANLIDMSQHSAFVDRGIILSTVTGDGPDVQFLSDMHNVIRGASTPHFIPTTGVTGNLMIFVE
jgi:hypothetical protein